MARPSKKSGYVWAAIDVDVFDNPDFAAAGELGVLIYVRSILYARKHLTDGAVPKRQVVSWLTMLDNELGGGRAAAIPEQLVAAGLWLDDGLMYVVARYDEYQATRAEVADFRESQAARARKPRRSRTEAAGSDSVEPDASRKLTGKQPTERETERDSLRSSVDAVWAAYERHSPRSVLSPARRSLIERRLKDGHSVEQLVAAIDGNRRERWHAERGKHEIEYVLRNAGNVERFAAELTRTQPIERVTKGASTSDLLAIARGNAGELAA